MLRGGDEAARETTDNRSGPTRVEAYRPGRAGSTPVVETERAGPVVAMPARSTSSARRNGPSAGGAPEPSSWDTSRPSWVGWARRAISACAGQRSDARCGDLQYVAGDCRWFKAKSATAAVVREGALRRPRRPPIGDVRIRTGRPTVNYDGRRRFRGWPAGRAGHGMSDGDHRAGRSEHDPGDRRRDRAATVWVCRGREIMTGGGRRHKDAAPTATRRSSAGAAPGAGVK
jgi:hypothetical protein